MAKTKSGANAGSGAAKRGAGPLAFMRQVRQEASKVTWPSRKETWVASVMVFIMVALAAIFFFIVDQVLAIGVRQILGLGG
jgi:preprotein translocase subunit SecE